jgi:hypothetical protein
VNGIVFLFSFSLGSLLVYRKATGFCMLILYPATLLNLLINSKSLLVVSLRIYKYRIISSAKRDYLNSSFPTCIPTISFSCQIALAKISSTILNKSDEGV